MSRAGSGAGGAPTASSFFAAWPIAAVAFLFLLPELIAGLSLSDSFVFNLGWGEQFRDLVRAGDPYPRWLPSSWEGAGSPTFYFYPPFFFWLVAAVDTVTFRLLPVSAAISLASFLVLAGSGLAMRAWLADRAGAKATTVGAVAYMLAPYHLYDLFQRGALAETCAYLFLPLVFLALRRIGRGRPGGVPFLAAAYAGMILSHLPLAVLAGATAIPAYLLFQLVGTEPGRWRHLSLAGLGALLALALSAIYWLPAITLLPHVSAEGLSGPYFRPDAWYFWRLADWPTELIKWIVLPSCAAALLLAWASARAGKGEGRFWAGLAAALVLLVAGIPPFFWDLPIVSQVQFPWRLLVIVEFALVTAVILARPGLGALPTRLALAPLALAFAVALMMVGYHALLSARAFEPQQASVRAGYRDAPEYLPRGFPLPLDDKQRPLPAAIHPPAVPLASLSPAGTPVDAQPLPNGGLLVATEAVGPARLVVRRFAFPHWRVTDETGRAIAVGQAGPLVAWEIAPGRHSYRLEPGRAPFERAGLLVSLAALIITVALALLARRGSSPKDKFTIAR